MQGLQHSSCFSENDNEKDSNTRTNQAHQNAFEYAGHRHPGKLGQMVEGTFVTDEASEDHKSPHCRDDSRYQGFIIFKSAVVRNLKSKEGAANGRTEKCTECGRHATKGKR